MEVRGEYHFIFSPIYVEQKTVFFKYVNMRTKKVEFYADPKSKEKIEKIC